MGKEPPTGSHQISFWLICQEVVCFKHFQSRSQILTLKPSYRFPAEVLTRRSCKKAVRKLVWNPLDLWWHEGSNSHPSIAPRVVIFDHHGSSRSAAHQAEASRLQMGSVLGMSRGLFLAYSPKNELKTVKPEKSPPLNFIFQTSNFQVLCYFSRGGSIIILMLLFPKGAGRLDDRCGAGSNWPGKSATRRG